MPIFRSQLLIAIWCLVGPIWGMMSSYEVTGTFKNLTPELVSTQWFLIYLIPKGQCSNLWLVLCHLCLSFHILLYLENTSYPSLQSLGLSLLRDKDGFTLCEHKSFLLSSISLTKTLIYSSYVFLICFLVSKYVPFFYILSSSNLMLVTNPIMISFFFPWIFSTHIHNN